MGRLRRRRGAQDHLAGNRETMIDPKLLMMLAVGTLLLLSGIFPSRKRVAPGGDRETL
jgi:hypothetical protein